MKINLFCYDTLDMYHNFIEEVVTQNQRKKIMFWTHIKKMTQSSLWKCHSLHEMISSSDEFLWLLQSAIHCFQLFLYQRKTKGFRTEVNPQGIGAKLVFSFANTYCFHTFSNVSFRGVIIKQPSTPAQATTVCFVDPLFVYRGSVIIVSRSIQLFL